MTPKPAPDFSNASPRPWKEVKRTTDAVVIDDANGKLVIVVSPDDAALIVAAINAYEPMRDAVRRAHDMLIEINPSNYNDDDVCELNNASVEAIFTLADVLGENHGKSKQWWDDRRAALAIALPATEDVKR